MTMSEVVPQDVIDQGVVVRLGMGTAPLETPVLRADDLGAIRGDGVFEALHVRDGRPWLMTEHLARMACSAASVELPLPSAERLEDLAEQALTAWPADTEGILRLICTRGPEDGHDGPTVLATISRISEAHRRARREGIDVRVASLGLSVEARRHAPWLLGGAKTLSYAVNMASQRWARAAGADDVLWTSAEGYLLEAPTSTLVWLDGSVLCTVPAERTGILAGTTARWLFDHAEALGWRTDERMVTAGEIIDCEGAWLTSSIRGVAGLRTIDGKNMNFSAERTDRIRTLLGFP
jgi:4-amino-4-deoxychorismate lyase